MWAVECYGSFQQDGDVSDTKVWECWGQTCWSPHANARDLSWSLRDRARGFPGCTEEEPGPDRALGGLLGVEVMGWTLCLNPRLTFFLRQPVKSLVQG